MRMDTILQAVGKTPLVRLNRVNDGLACELYGKCEFLNPGGSVKDRAAISMLEKAEREGHIKPGDTLIEPTSGNTGIGIAMVAAVKGYKVIITMPEKMSYEKEAILKALGATIYRTPSHIPWNDPESHISLAKRLLNEIPHAFSLNQYVNPANVATHYTKTAQEILDDVGDNLAMVVCSVGTGGTITGLAKKYKEMGANIRMVGADPYGSILGGGEESYPFLVEGIGYDFIPDILDNSLVDEYVKVQDKDSFLTARRLIREEGLLVGGSSGTAVWAALQAAKSLSKKQKCVVILPDCMRNYITTFVNDDWMKKHGF